MHVAVVLNRGSRRFKDGLSEVPHAVVYQGMRPLGEGKSSRRGRVAVGVVTVVPTERRGQVLTQGLIDLNAAIDGVFLVPDDAALDVEVLVGKGGLGAHQRGKRADKELGGLSHVAASGQATGTGPKKLFTVSCASMNGTAECRQGICARLDVALEISVRFLNEDLPIAQRGLRPGVSRTRNCSGTARNRSGCH